MNFMTAVSTCFKKYATFSGRASRSEYWYFTLFYMVVSAVLGLIFQDQTMSVISNVFSLVTLVPTLAVSWRRMHDIGKVGAWSFIVLVPVVGVIILLIWCCKDSEEGPNEFGENPKGE